MNLIFRWQDIAKRSRGLTFDDVLLVPVRSDVRSRRDPQLDTQLTRKVRIQTPIVAANMDTVTESEMAIAMQGLGAFAILHRFMPIEEQARHVRQVRAAGCDHCGASIGVGDDYQERARQLIEVGADVITVDIAHGHSMGMLKCIEWLKNTFQHIEVIGGNVATPDGTRDLIEAGADAIKVGIGPGSMCTTRIITGCGVPQLTAIAICAEVAMPYQVPIIADGGIRTSGDIVKAFAAGASSVMLGSMLAGTIEAPGEIRGGRKQYRGMASKAAQVSWRGGIPEGMAAEGESTFIAVKGRVRDVILEITGGIRSGMSYMNATTLSEILEKARLMEMTHSGSLESQAHGLRS